MNNDTQTQEAQEENFVYEIEDEPIMTLYDKDNDKGILVA